MSANQSVYSQGGPEHSHHGPGPGATDPTGTTVLRRRYAQRLRGRFADINTQIRDGVRERDVFGLSRTEALADSEPVPNFEFETTRKKKAGFLAWLRRQMREQVLTVISRNENQYIRSAYRTGYQTQISDYLPDETTVEVPAGVDTSRLPDAQVALDFNMPVRKQTLQRLYTRNFNALEAITQALDREISEILTRGFAEGYGTDKMARELTHAVNTIGKNRATILARTETVRAANEGALDRYESSGIERVGARVEFLATGDERTCPECRALDGEVYSIDEARGNLPRHAQCRCTWIPYFGD